MPTIKISGKNIKIKIGAYEIKPSVQSKIIEPKTIEQVITPDDGVFALSSVIVNPVTNNIDENIKAENIKNGVSILGIEGTVEPFREPVLQDKTVNPTTEIQEIVADEGYDALNKVVVTAQTGITPSGEINITSNGIYDVTQYATANVEIPMEYNAKIKTVAPAGANNMLFNRLVEKFAETIDASEVTSLNSAFNYCIVEEISIKNTNKVTAMASAFANNPNLKKVGAIDASSMPNFFSGSQTSHPFYQSTGLTDFGGFIDIGKSYNKTGTGTAFDVNMSICINLNHDSLINLLNGAYDLVAGGIKNHSFIIGSTNLAKLEATEEGRQSIQNIQLKGWTLS